jgi:hypothetical protein
VVGEPGRSHVDGICYRLGVPRPGTRSGSSPITSTRGVGAVVSTAEGCVVKESIIGTTARSVR